MTSMTHAAKAVLFAVLSGAVLSPVCARAAELCGRPGGTPAEVFDRLTKVEKLPETFRDASYVALSDQANLITWTFTRPGHAAHPTVVCRRIVREADGNPNLVTEISCDAVEAACLGLKRDFEALNARMIDAMRKQSK